MKEISRRPMPTETAGITDIETFIHEGVKFAKLMTAADNGKRAAEEVRRAREQAEHAAEHAAKAARHAAGAGAR